MRGGQYRIEAAWLDECTGTAYCAPFVAECSNWRAYEADLTTAGGPRVTMVARVPPGDGDARRELDIVNMRLVPLVRAMTRLLQAACMERETVHVTYVACEHKRVLPQVAELPLGPVHVNGGVAFLRDGRVLVYRKEDACKVMMHELLHMFGADAAIRGDSVVEQTLCQRFNVVSSIGMAMGEVFVDAIACYLHALWEAALRGLRAAQAGEYVGRQAKHVRLVAARVLRHFGRLPFGVRRNAGAGTAAIRENTHAFSYYVCKAAVWQQDVLPIFLAAYPPGRLPTDTRRFADFISEALMRFNVTRKPQRDCIRMTLWTT